MAFTIRMMSNKKRQPLFFLTFPHEKSTLNKPKLDVYSREKSSIKLLCKQARLKEALDILNTMEYRDLDSNIYASILQGCVNNNNKNTLTLGKLIHAHMTHTGFHTHRFLVNGLLHIYAKRGKLEDARKMFDEMPERDVCSWSIIIAAYSRHDSVLAQQALALFRQMQRVGLRANEFTFASLISGCAKLVALKQGMEIHKVIIVSGYESDVTVTNAIVDMYAKCGSLKDARKLFDIVSQRNVVSWTALFSGYAQNGYFEEALRLFRDMPERDTVSWTAMIVGLLQNGLIDEAMEMFREMPERDVASWTVMIAGFAKSGRSVEALELFRQMEASGMKPDAKTFSCVLPACANLAALEQGMEIHKEIIRSEFRSVVFVQSALVDMYAKCGKLEKARELFDEMSARDVVSWNTMIEGYAMHGLAKEAFKLFEQMQQQSGISPNHATFVSVLSACCHAGLVNEGRQYFDCMSQDYHVRPAMQHYACIVDLLGRAGYLDEAEDFINKMPICPDATVWRSLLAACRVYNNIDLGQRVAAHILGLDPNNVGPYVLLSNMYAAAGRWDDAECVRKTMKDARVKYTPGCSWIEVNKEVYTFLVSDRLQPQTQDICAEHLPGTFCTA